MADMTLGKGVDDMVGPDVQFQNAYSRLWIWQKHFMKGRCAGEMAV